VEHDAATVVSELATNALLHARTDFTLTLELQADQLRIALADGSSAAPRVRRFSDTEATTGRGLKMVAALAQAWGIDPADNGKSVWCAVRLPSRTGEPRTETSIGSASTRDGSAVEPPSTAYDNHHGGRPTVPGLLSRQQVTHVRRWISV